MSDDYLCTVQRIASMTSLAKFRPWQNARITSVTTRDVRLPASNILGSEFTNTKDFSDEMEIVEKDGKFDFLRDGELVKSSVPRAMLQHAAYAYGISFDDNLRSQLAANGKAEVTVSLGKFFQIG